MVTMHMNFVESYTVLSTYFTLLLDSSRFYRDWNRPHFLYISTMYMLLYLHYAQIYIIKCLMIECPFLHMDQDVNKQIFIGISISKHFTILILSLFNGCVSSYNHYLFNEFLLNARLVKLIKLRMSWIGF